MNDAIVRDDDDADSCCCHQVREYVQTLHSTETGHVAEVIERTERLLILL